MSTIKEIKKMERKVICLQKHYTLLKNDYLDFYNRLRDRLALCPYNIAYNRNAKKYLLHEFIDTELLQKLETLTKEEKEKLLGLDNHITVQKRISDFEREMRLIEFLY